ncbi:MAG: hypothetical protein ACR2H9_08995, partial [Longimicrobiaceae bacterium]
MALGTNDPDGPSAAPTEISRIPRSTEADQRAEGSAAQQRPARFPLQSLDSPRDVRSAAGGEIAATRAAGSPLEKPTREQVVEWLRSPEQLHHADGADLSG